MARMRWIDDTPLANRDYSLFLVGAFVSSLGGWMQNVALGWTILQLGNSSFVLGLLGFVQTAPVLLLGIPAGSLADRANRRKVLLATQAAATVLTVVLALLQTLERNTVASILVIAAASGVINALNGPSWQAFIKELVGKEQLRRAVAINSVRFNLTRIAGPAIGGWLLVTAGAAACFWVNAVSFVAVIAALFFIRARAAPVVGTGNRGLSAVLAVARNPRIRSVLLPAIGLTVLALPYGSFLPQMARDVFDAGPGGLSLLLTATGVGALGGAFVSGLPWVARRPLRALAALEVVTGVALVAFALSPNLVTGMVAIAVFGGSLIGYLATAGASVQLAAEPGTEGRALGLWMIVNSGLVPIGSLAIGAAAELLHLPYALALAGAGCAIAGIVANARSGRAARASVNTASANVP
jgi:predicted MFS family arabinose efflux permease